MLSDTPNSINVLSGCASPVRVSSSHSFGVTPFGIYCFKCDLPVGCHGADFTKDTIRCHLKRKNHTEKDNLQPIDILSSLKKEMKNQFGKLTNYDDWIKDKNVKQFQCSCGFLTRKPSNLKRHIESSGKKNNGVSHFQTDTVSCVLTSCSRTIPTSCIPNMTTEDVEIVSVSSVSHTTYTSNATTNDSLEYIPIQRANSQWVTMTLDKIKTIFTPYKRPNETLDPYLPSLKLMTVNGNGPVIERVSECLTLIDKDQKENDATLNFFMNCCEKWITTYCREHVNILDAQTRFELQSYFDESVLVNSSYKLNFNMRENEETIAKEALIIARLSWKLHGLGLCNRNLSKVISELKIEIQKVEIHSCGEASELAVQTMIQRLLIQRYLHSILIEARENAYYLLLGHHMIMLRLFKTKKSVSDENNEVSLSMRNCGEFGSIISLHIHIYRLASASLIACTEMRCWKGILSKGKQSALCHMISPLVNKVKHMNNEKIEVRKKVLKPNGDITIDNFEFPKCLWSTMVPKIIGMFHALMDTIFREELWKRIVDVKNEIHVTKLDDEASCHRHELLHYNFYTNISGRIINEKDLHLRQGLSEEAVEKLTGLVMICLHGLGLGSARVSEIIRLQQHQLEWKGGSVYYLTVSNKRRSSKMNNKTTVTHKLPSCISRYILLYDWIGRQISSGRQYFLFSYNVSDINDMYQNKWFFDQFASIFEFEENCCSLVMRHLYTSICNYIFPANANSIDSSTVSTVGQIAEMSGHTLETHEQYYSSMVSKELSFEKYHLGIGAEIALDREEMTPLGLATEEDVLHCLRVLLGVEATFFSDLQKKMVIDACNNQSKHTFCSIGCGGGKSMSWTIAALRQKLKGRRANLSIVVVPYCFLLDHHVSSTERMLGQCSNLSVRALKGSDIEDNILPNILRDKTSLPSILFVSLEAIRILVQHHCSHLQQLDKENLLCKIYIDECHTIFSELNFRESYFCLAKLAQLGIPITVFSGSFQRSLIKDFLGHMFGSVDTKKYNIFIDNDLFGTKMMKMNHIASEDYVTICCNDVLKFLTEHKESNVHIIVSTKDEGKWVICECHLLNNLLIVLLF